MHVVAEANDATITPASIRRLTLRQCERYCIATLAGVAGRQPAITRPWCARSFRCLRLNGNIKLMKFFTSSTLYPRRKVSGDD